MAVVLPGVTNDSTSALSMSRLYCRYSHEHYEKLFVRSIKKDFYPPFELFDFYCWIINLNKFSYIKNM